MTASSPFDRVRPRTGEPVRLATGEPCADPDGKRALFSAQPAGRVAGTVTVACSRCHASTALGLLAAARLLIPSVHLPVLRRRDPSLLRCPACGQLAWVTLRLRL